MSISLPNGTLLVAPSSSTQQYTAAVTRILHLSNFSAELKTRDLQALFRDYETEKGGFRIKWLDDVNALVVFGEASVAKRAYLSFLLSPPPQFGGQIRPYDKPDAAQIIQSLAARSMGHRGSNSIAQNGDAASAFGSGHGHGHTRSMSTSGAGSSAFNSWSFGGSSGASAGVGVGGLGAGKARASISGPAPVAGGRGLHSRTGSGAAASFSSASGAGSRNGGGVFNWNNSGALGGVRLATHTESAHDTSTTPQSRSASSSDTEPVIVMEPPSGSKAFGGGFGNWKMGVGAHTNNLNNGHGAIGGHRSSMSAVGGRSTSGGQVRRDSLSAEKAMKEVEKALASVDVHS